MEVSDDQDDESEGQSDEQGESEEQKGSEEFSDLEEPQITFERLDACFHFEAPARALNALEIEHREICDIYKLEEIKLKNTFKKLDYLLDDHTQSRMLTCDFEEIFNIELKTIVRGQVSQNQQKLKQAYNAIRDFKIALRVLNEKISRLARE